MRIGIYIPNANEKTGGGFTFENTIITALLESDSPHQFFIFNNNKSHKVSPNIEYYSLTTSKPTQLDTKSSHMSIYILFDKIRKMIIRLLLGKEIRVLQNSIERTKELLEKQITILNKYSDTDNELNNIAKQLGIDLFWFITPAFKPIQIPYIYTVWDLGHRTNTCFPELSTHSWNWDLREEHNKNIIQKSAYLISGTDAGMKDIEFYYSVNTSQIKVIPFPVPPVNSIIQNDSLKIKHNLDKPFIFYPAQFWPHKNHILILHALQILINKYQLEYYVVFTGDNNWDVQYNHKDYIQKQAQEMKIEKYVKFLGFVERSEVIELYKNAEALVYSSFLGPDNIPPLEAMALGCPCIVSDINGAREQYQNAALYFNPTDETSLAELIMQLRLDDKLKKTIVDNGFSLIQQKTPREYIKKIHEVFNEFEKLKRCWGHIYN